MNPSELYNWKKTPSWHWSMIMFMNNKYNNLVIPGCEEEDYCAEMISSQNPSFLEVLSDGFDFPDSMKEELIYIWLEAIRRTYGEQQLFFPDDPLEGNKFLQDIGNYVGINMYVEPFYSGVGFDDLFA